MSDANPGSGGFAPPPSTAHPAAASAAGQGDTPIRSPGPLRGTRTLQEQSYAEPLSSYPAAAPVGAYPQMPGYGMPPQPSNGMGTTGLVLGIIGVVCSVTFFLWFFGVILGILGIIFGAIGRGKANRGEATNRGAATAGLSAASWPR
ncbi:hypothetical protein SALBM311S_00488 [Streptomyces alboniger]